MNETNFGTLANNINNNNNSPVSKGRRGTLLRNNLRVKGGANASTKKDITLLPQKKEVISKFRKLVEAKNIKKMENSVSAETNKIFQELSPYQYYDEVINDYFKGDDMFLH